MLKIVHYSLLNRKISNHRRKNAIFSHCHPFLTRSFDFYHRFCLRRQNYPLFFPNLRNFNPALFIILSRLPYSANALISSCENHLPPLRRFNQTESPFLYKKIPVVPKIETTGQIYLDIRKLEF